MSKNTTQNTPESEKAPSNDELIKQIESTLAKIDKRITAVENQIGINQPIPEESQPEPNPEL